MFNHGCSTGYSLADIAAATGNGSNNNGAWGDGSWWIIILFLALFGGWGNGGFGWGGNSGGGESVRSEVAYGFDINGLENGVRGIQNGLSDGFYAMNTSMLNGFNGVQNTLCQGFAGINQGITNSTIAGMQNTNAITAQLTAMAADSAACCCETQRAIERGFADTNYNMATQACDTRRAIADTTRDIIDNQNAGIRSILDFLTQDKIATLTAENQSLKFAASQQAQNNYLVSKLTDPCPVPAYMVPNPNCCYTYDITRIGGGCGASNYNF